MKWYKHFSRAHRDTKIKKLINEFGADAYAVYFYCLELIAESIDTDNITFELEDDAELIGQYLRIDTLRIERIMLKCIELDLFGQNDNGRITCFKMAKFLDDRLTRNVELKTIISSNKIIEIKEKLTNKENLSKMSETVTDKTRHSATVAVCPDQIRLDEIRLDEIREDNNIQDTTKNEIIPETKACENNIPDVKTSGKRIKKTKEPYLTDEQKKDYNKLIEYFSKTYNRLYSYERFDDTGNKIIETRELSWNDKEYVNAAKIIKNYTIIEITEKLKILEQKCKMNPDFFIFIPSCMFSQWLKLVKSPSLYT